MAPVAIRDVRKAFGAVEVIHGVSVLIGDGEFVVLVGPSGCGKSTLLRMIAGLEEISSGSIAIGGRQVNNLPPKERDVAMVFQNYALYPHMTVYDNMAFSLKLRKADAKLIGTPLELYDHPVNTFVAGFIGSPAMNFLSGTLRNGGGAARVETAGGQTLAAPRTGNGRDGQKIVFGIRPEHLSLGAGRDG